jgi:hypothetical protein
VTYVSKFRPAGGRVVACYTCPDHGKFNTEVDRDERGEAPDAITCRYGLSPETECTCTATWTPTPIPGRVRRIEVSRGGWQKPERSTYLDTRKLGEGQSLEEFQAERKKVWQRKREADVMEIKKGFY